MSGINLNISEILRQEGAQVISDIRDSMENNGQWASGQTASKIRMEYDDDSLIILAPDYFKTLEKGISPQEARSTTPRFLRQQIFIWAEKKGGVFSGTRDAWRFASNTTNKMREEGSMLFRDGGRTDVYSDKVDPLVNRISDKLANSLLSVKVLQDE